MAPSLALSPMVATRVVLGRRRVRRRRRRPRRRPVCLPVMAAAAATVVVVGRRHRGEGGERDGRTRGLCRPGGPSSSHTCSPLLLLLLKPPLHTIPTINRLLFSLFFAASLDGECLRRRRSADGRRAADASEGGGRGRLARSRSVRRSRSVIPTREDERERGRKRGKNGTDAPDGSRGGRRDADGRRVDLGAAAVKMENTTGSPRRHTTYVALQCTDACGP